LAPTLFSTTGLAERDRELVGDVADDDRRGAACRERNDHADQPARIAIVGLQVSAAEHRG
jgi:hypothetical protein